MPFLSPFLHPHLPDLALLAQVSPVIVIHLLFAVAAFSIGFIQIFGARLFGWGGNRMHRILGWTWVVMMLTVALSSFFIHVINPQGFSLIHILSVVTLVLLPIGVVAARRHNIALHSRIMTNLFIGALVLAGIFTFLPGRLMYRMFFG